MYPLKIEHIAIYVKDLEKTRDFFKTYFSLISNDGYYNAETGFKSYFLCFDSGARLEIMNKPNLTDNGEKNNRFGYAHIAISVGSREEVDILTERLRSDGYEILSGPRTTGDGYYESCIVGIEGNLIEITV